MVPPAGPRSAMWGASQEVQPLMQKTVRTAMVVHLTPPVALASEMLLVCRCCREASHMLVLEVFPLTHGQGKTQSVPAPAAH
jgi:hypothetical protein